jgi:predicted nucleic acid-binding protein
MGDQQAFAVAPELRRVAEMMARIDDRQIRLQLARTGGSCRARRRVIVVDASALLEALLRTPAAAAVEERLFDLGETLHAPHLIDIEVAQVLRRYAETGQIVPGRCREALDDLSDFPLYRYPHDVVLGRVWELRHNLTAYDAVYVALAEALDAPLLTRDRRLATAAGHHARIDLV